MQNPSRTHHYIPVFLTKAWADSSGTVIRYSKHRHVSSKRVFPRAVFWREDLYRLPMNSGVEAQRIEDEFLKKLDCSASQIHRKLNSDQSTSLTSDEKIEWSIFLLSLILRSPQNINAQKARMAGYWSETIRQLSLDYDRLKNDNDPKTFEEFAQTLHPQSSEQYGLEILPTLMVNQKIAEFMTNLRWSIIDTAESRFGLLLSDDPVFIPTGLETDYGVIAVPISPTRIFVAARQIETLQLIRRLSPNNIVRNINKWSVEGAREYVVACDAGQDDFVKARFGNALRQPIIAKIPDEKAGEVGAYVVDRIENMRR